MDAAKELVKQGSLLETVREEFQERKVTIVRHRSEFPELSVTVPDDWPYIDLAPLYDVHIGNSQHDGEMFDRHLKWLRTQPYVLTFNGGDMIENANKLSVGSGVYYQDLNPGNQLTQSLLKLARIRHKMMFALPGNHEDRTQLMGVDVGEVLATLLEVPYFPDYCFCVVKWRGNNFRIMAHHGSGGAQTAGAQRMAARKDLAWAKPFDLYWSGHLHSALVDTLYQTDFDQKSGRIFERNGLVIISPSYLRYFGTYAAKARMVPGTRGLAVVRLNEDGRMDVSIHSRGRRL